MQGTNGVYRAKRWKSPELAMKEIKKQMKVSPNANLSFKSKKYKDIILNEKQLIDQYWKQRPNGTIQEFIKHNFIVGKAQIKRDKGL